MSFRDTLTDWQDRLRHRWMYRKGRSASGPTAGSSAASSASRFSWPVLSLGALKWIVVPLVIFAIFYYPIGALIVHQINDDLDFRPPSADRIAGGSEAVAMAAGLIDREVNQTRWVANDPFFLPGAFLDNMPNYQQGIVAALARFSFELTDQLGRTRGSSQADTDLQNASGLLQYAGDIWVWDPSVSIAPRATSEAQYRAARRALLAYNERLAKGDAVFERRADNLLATLDRIALDLGSSSAALERAVAEDSGGWIDSNADDQFYTVKGQTYGYYMILSALGRDFEKLIAERELTSSWQQMLASLAETARLQPWVVVNGDPDAQFMPSHLAVQGFYLLRARTQIREITNILLK